VTGSKQAHCFVGDDLWRKPREVTVAPITASIDIARRREDVFAYLDELGRHGEWQEQIVSAQVDGEGPTQVGTRSTERRRMGGREQTMTYAVTEHDPPGVFAFRGVDGPVRVVGRVTLDPISEGSSTRVSLVLDFEGHGFGKALVPLARSQTRKQVPKDQQRLKERLEGGA
jgi:Polyketide cyclase / dehydrase and lipid transport